MRFISTFIILTFLVACDKNKIINKNALIPLQNPAISAYIDVDKNEISVFISVITPFEEEYSYANSVIKDAKVYYNKKSAQMVFIPFMKEKYISAISVSSGDTIDLTIEWRNKKYKAQTIIPFKATLGEIKKVDTGLFSAEITKSNKRKDILYYWITPKSSIEVQTIGFSMVFPEKYIFSTTDSISKLNFKLSFFDKNLLNKPSLFYTVNVTSLDKNLFEYMKNAPNTTIDSREMLKSSFIISNFNNGATGFFGSLINKEIQLQVN